MNINLFFQFHELVRQFYKLNKQYGAALNLMVSSVLFLVITTFKGRGGQATGASFTSHSNASQF